MGIGLGMREIAVAVISIIILLIITLILLGVLEPGSESSFLFGSKSAVGGIGE